MICPHCQTNNPDAARFCMNCGRELIHRCPNCLTELAPDARFCKACGQPVLMETTLDTDRLSRLTSTVPQSLIHKLRSMRISDMARPAGSLGEQRTITALLIDVIGSTALSTQLGSDLWLKIIDQASEKIASIIFRYEGTIVRLLGDTLLAFFGAPVAHEDDPQRAVGAGLDIVAQMRSYSQEITELHGVTFAVRACINTGPVVIGPVGEDLSYDYTNEGSTVNLASRIKFASQSMGVLVTANTYRFIAPFFECVELAPVEVKGMVSPLRVYEVKAPRLISVQARGFKDIGSPMVGREKELNILSGLCEAVQAGLGRAVLILGEPGLGKTRLIQEWQKAVKCEPSPATSLGKSSHGRWVNGRCTSYGQGAAYQLMTDVLRDLIGMPPSDDEQASRSRLFQTSAELLGEDSIQVYPYIGRMLSIKLEGEAADLASIGDPQALQTQYLLAVQRLFQAYMNQGPLILVLEDLHWADSASIDLFTKLLPLISKGAILFCLVTRPESISPGWKLVSAAREMLGGSLTEIVLNALSESDSRTLVANLLQLESLPKQVRELILRKSEGNPYFVEEVIRMLIEGGAIINHDGAWIAQKEISEHEIPDNLQGLLMARIDRLPLEARYTLLVASVIGRNFPVRVLSHVVGEV